MTTLLSRLPGWWVSICLLFGLLLAISPHQVGVILYKALLVCVGIVLAYLSDKALFQNAPTINETLPHDSLGAARLIARALIATAVVLGLTIGI